MQSLNQPRFRPPADADSLLIQADVGCPHNQCTFCGMYKGVRYQRRSMLDVQQIVQEATRDAPRTRRVFLTDGDVMRRPVEELTQIATWLKQALPRLSRINLYATGRAIASKSDAELRQLRQLHYQTLYLGLESGDEATLEQMKKGETATAMVDSAQRAQQAGLRISVMVLLGLAGKTRSLEHARATAAALNTMQPRLLSALRVVPVPGTELAGQAESGEFDVISEHAVVRELRELVAHLKLQRTIFRANHSSNVIPLEARFPADQPRLLAQLDRLLNSGSLSQSSPGQLPMWL